MKRKIYIAGKITGLLETTYTNNFKFWQNHYQDLGYLVLNPVEFCKDIPKDSPHEVFMERCIPFLKICDEIFVQNNWRDSKGTMEELQKAKELKLEITFEAK